MFILDFVAGLAAGVSSLFIFRPKLKSQTKGTQTDPPPQKTVPLGIPHLKDFWTNYIPE
jgi:hypothetical protein